MNTIKKEDIKISKECYNCNNIVTNWDFYDNIDECNKHNVDNIFQATCSCGIKYKVYQRERIPGFMSAFVRKVDN